MPAEDSLADELTAAIQAVRERVRARHAQGPPPAGAALPLPELTPILHARDRAEGKAAAIGTVNPRPPGLLNSAIQALKRSIARALGWFVRDQIEYNLALLGCVEAMLRALNEYNRSLQVLSARMDRGLAAAEALTAETSQLKDIRAHWLEWRREWERKLSINEVQFLRSAADLQSGFQHRVAQMESNFRDLLRSQHADFTRALERSGQEIQQRLWKDLERIQDQYLRLIHEELRLLRQRAALAPRLATAAPVSAAETPLDYDALLFAEKFRGSERYVSECQRPYVAWFQGCRNVLDIGCGRGEFLELCREAAVGARGIDSSAENVALCRNKGLAAERADLFEHLESMAAGALDGVFCAQVIEHLTTGEILRLVRLCADKLAPGGVLVIETPNPECLAIFATHFYLDPTHQRPVPPALLTFFLEESGFQVQEVLRRAPACEQIPALASLPEALRERLFGGMDYAVRARRP